MWKLKLAGKAALFWLFSWCCFHTWYFTQLRTEARIKSSAQSISPEFNASSSNSRWSTRNSGVSATSWKFLVKNFKQKPKSSSRSEERARFQIWKLKFNNCLTKSISFNLPNTRYHDWDVCQCNKTKRSQNLRRWSTRPKLVAERDIN